MGAWEIGGGLKRSSTLSRRAGSRFAFSEVTDQDPAAIETLSVGAERIGIQQSGH
jgi:hypothetical protein